MFRSSNSRLAHFSLSLPELDDPLGADAVGSLVGEHPLVKVQHELRPQGGAQRRQLLGQGKLEIREMSELTTG